MNLNFLSADVPLSKSYTLSHERIIKSPYPHVTYFSSHQTTISTTVELYKEIKTHAAKGHCLLKGTLNRPLAHESRAGSTNSDDETQWVCLDIDGLHGFTKPQEIMDLLGLQDITYIVQWSASAGIDTERGMSCHLFFLLDTPVRAPILKQWLMHLNLNARHTVTERVTETVKGKTRNTQREVISRPLRTQIRLTRTGAALRWPLDITVCQNDKLIYIAPPTLGEGVSCSIKPASRITLVKRPLPTMPSSRIEFSTLSAALEDARSLRDELRVKSGMPKLRTGSLKWVGGLEIQRNPGQALVTGYKEDRGFTYLNLNGGDSWGYYHPSDDASKIFNFKGEPVYITEELLPEYHAAWVAQHNKAQSAEVTGLEVFVFCDPRTGHYHKGLYHLESQRLDLWIAKSEKQVQDFLAQHGQPAIDVIEDWRLTFDPQNAQVFDRDARFINQYQASPILRTALRSRKAPASCAQWPTIDMLITSAIGDDGEVKEHFLNWLACLLQYRDKILTAWILQGIPGTGKGMLIERVLAPILGQRHVLRCNQATLHKGFNNFLETALLVLIDEMRMSAYTRQGESAAATEKLKNWITEPVIMIEGKHAHAYNTRNYANFIIASNQPDVQEIDPKDRRFNVGNYQDTPLLLSTAQVEALDNEVATFAQYLARRPADRTVARTVLDTEARRQMQKLTRNAGDLVGDAFREGDFGFFFDSLPDPNSKLDPFSDVAIAGTAYLLWFSQLTERLANGTTEQKITRDELYTVFNYLVGDMPRSPNKFTAYLKHRRLHTVRLRLEDQVTMGVTINWHADEDTLKLAQRMLARTAKPALKAVGGNQ